jgi:hypothetical protein
MLMSMFQSPNTNMYQMQNGICKSWECELQHLIYYLHDATAWIHF